MQHPFVTGEELESHPLFHGSVRVSTVEILHVIRVFTCSIFFIVLFATIRKTLKAFLCQVPRTWKSRKFFSLASPGCESLGSIFCYAFILL